jgi:hypothetical protein
MAGNNYISDVLNGVVIIKTPADAAILMPLKIKTASPEI